MRLSVCEFSNPLNLQHKPNVSNVRRVQVNSPECASARRFLAEQLAERSEHGKASSDRAAGSSGRRRRSQRRRRALPSREGRRQIDGHARASLLDTPIAAVTAIDLLDALVPVMRKVQDTGWRVYQRLGTVFDAAVIERLRPDNPAAPIRREYASARGVVTPAAMQRCPIGKYPASCPI